MAAVSSAALAPSNVRRVADAMRAAGTKPDEIFEDQVAELLRRMEEATAPLFLAKKEQGLIRSALIAQGGRYILMTRVRGGGDLLRGKGTFKEAKLAIRIDGEELIVGIVRKSECPPADWGKMLREYEIMKAIKGQKGLLQLEDFYHRIIGNPETEENLQEKLYFVMERCHEKNLYDSICEEKTALKLTPKDRLQIIKDVALGVYNLHELKIVHRDIKPENVFLKEAEALAVQQGSEEKSSELEASSREPIHAKVADFSLSCKIDDRASMEELCGSYQFIPPERARLASLSRSERETSENKEKIATTSRFAADVWALGATFFALLHPLGCELNCQQVDQNEGWESRLFTKIELVRHRDLIKEIDSSGIDRQFHDLLKRMLHPDPTKRPSMAEVLGTVCSVIEIEMAAPASIAQAASAPSQRARSQ
jgi:serine/threonine protein kinase